MAIHAILSSTFFSLIFLIISKRMLQYNPTPNHGGFLRNTGSNAPPASAYSCTSATQVSLKVPIANTKCPSKILPFFQYPQ